MLLSVSEGDFSPVDVGLQLAYNILYGLCHCLEDGLVQAKRIEYITVLTVVVVDVKEGSEPFVFLESPFCDAAFMDGVGTILGQDIIDDVSYFYIVIVQ